MVGKCVDISLDEGLIVIKTPDDTLTFIKDMKTLYSLGYVK